LSQKRYCSKHYTLGDDALHQNREDICNTQVKATIFFISKLSKVKSSDKSKIRIDRKRFLKRGKLYRYEEDRPVTEQRIKMASTVG
jgi:hypothetical protein